VASYKLYIKPSAVKEIESLPKKDRARIINKIQGLAAEPRPPGCEKLTGEEKYRIRQGRFRIIYSITDKELVVIVVKVGHRRDIYKKAT
jgi:mRNA interferase RelE/StbE